MMEPFPDSWGDQLQRVSVAKHCIDLTTDATPVNTTLYGAKAEVRETQRSEIVRMLEQK